MGVCAGLTVAFILAAVIQIASYIKQKEEENIADEANTEIAEEQRNLTDNEDGNKSAGTKAANRNLDKGITLFKEERDCISKNRFQVFRVLDSGSALARELRNDFATPIPTGLEILFIEEGKDSYYDEQIITIPSGKCAKQIGIYKYRARTVPVVAIRR